MKIDSPLESLFIRVALERKFAATQLTQAADKGKVRNCWKRAENRFVGKARNCSKRALDINNIVIQTSL